MFSLGIELLLLVTGAWALITGELPIPRLNCILEKVNIILNQKNQR